MDSYNVIEMKSEEENWEISRENIRILTIVGEGSFGQVAKGLLIHKTMENEQTEVVAIKMVKEDCLASDRLDLISELKIMKKLARHPNVIYLLGCVTKSEPILVVISFVPFGDLLGYLRKSRGHEDYYYNDSDMMPKISLTSRELIRFAKDIACGMEFLEANKVIHRDLAARNVLVGEELVCKITDFGMARDVYKDDIYIRTSKGRIPVKWTAYESLMYNTYTSQSDVWSYGIVLYEIFTIGETPYPGIKGRDVCALLKDGYRLEKPEHVSREIYSMMLQCWKTTPSERPSFSSLKKSTSDMEMEHHTYVNMKNYNSSLYENFDDLE